MTANLPPPTEEQEQAHLFAWAKMSRSKYPELCLLYAVPNGGYRTKTTAARMKATGEKAGVPDICLPVARGGFHGLYIELKRVRGGRISTEQMEWIQALRIQGYQAIVCKGFDEARRCLCEYLEEDEHGERGD